MTEAKGGNKPKNTKAEPKAGKKPKAEAQPEAPEVDANDYRQLRLDMIESLKEKGTTAYPHKYEGLKYHGVKPDFFTQPKIKEFIASHESFEAGCMGEKLWQLCGRISRVAGSGPKLRFYDLVEDDVKVQIMASAGMQKDEEYSFLEAHKCIKRGDIVGVTGLGGRSKTGELSIFAQSIRVLAPCLKMLPMGYQGLVDKEVRYRHRALDLIANPSNKEVFRTRAKIVQYIRNYLVNRDFIEVETPMMNIIHGGATAKPFKTFHNDLKQELFMRVAPELYLKRLVVGGLDRVFEVGKNFRNEGIDLTHNPEFTAIEFYCAYIDYHDLMKMTEEMISGLVMEVHGSMKVNYQAMGEEEETEIDFTTPWPRVPFVDEIEKRSGKTLIRPLQCEENISLMKEMCKEAGLDEPRPPTCTKLLDTLCGRFIEDVYGNNPFFIIDHPEVMSPLAKYHREKPEMTERGELFVMGKELANFYTELNDPIHQRKLFMAQVQDAAAGDDEAQPYDEDYCDTLELGLPPTGGWGLGVDRLTMFLTNKNNIKEVILFPAMRPQLHTDQHQEEGKGSAPQIPKLTSTDS